MGPYILAILGLVFIFVEFYLPGGIMAVIGSLAILAGIVMFAEENQSMTALIFFIIGITISLAILIRLTLWAIIHSKSGYSIYSNQDQKGYVASTYDEKAIGKKAIVVTDLKPGGFILLEDKQHAAISISGYISQGEEVDIIDGQEQVLMVKQTKKETSL